MIPRRAQKALPKCTPEIMKIKLLVSTVWPLVLFLLVRPFAQIPPPSHAAQLIKFRGELAHPTAHTDPRLGHQMIPRHAQKALPKHIPKTMEIKLLVSMVWPLGLFLLVRYFAQVPPPNPAAQPIKFRDVLGTPRRSQGNLRLFSDRRFPPRPA